MRHKKDILFLFVLALLGAWVLVSARNAEKQTSQSCLPGGKCTQNIPAVKETTPLNFISRGIFHLPS